MKKIDLENRVKELEQKNIKLIRENEFMCSELISINQGLGTRPNWFDESKHTWDIAIKNAAGLAIKKVLEMRK